MMLIVSSWPATCLYATWFSLPHPDQPPVYMCKMLSNLKLIVATLIVKRYDYLVHGLAMDTIINISVPCSVAIGVLKWCMMTDKVKKKPHLI